MTNIPQTIKVHYNAFTGSEVREDCYGIIKGGRSSGRTTAGLLTCIALSLDIFGNTFYIDHAMATKSIALHNRGLAKSLIKQLGLNGFKVSVRSIASLRGVSNYNIISNGSRIYGKVDSEDNANWFGVFIEFSPVVEVTYELRK